MSVRSHECALDRAPGEGFGPSGPFERKGCGRRSLALRTPGHPFVSLALERHTTAAVRHLEQDALP
jgi:hypothetical protein